MTQKTAHKRPKAIQLTSHPGGRGRSPYPWFGAHEIRCCAGR